MLQRFSSFFHKCKIHSNPLIKLCTHICVGYTSAAANRRTVNNYLKCDIMHADLSNVKTDIMNIFHASNININDVHGEVIRDLCGVRDRTLDCILNYSETCELINFVCLM